MGRKLLETGPPMRFPSPAATMMAVTCMLVREKMKEPRDSSRL